jgi:hypothetical protein
MATRPIKITASNSSNGSLTLDDHGHTTAKPGDTILWQIGNDSGVDSIISIQEKYGSTNIFLTPPYKQGNNWRGDIDPHVPLYTVYLYSITWLAKDGSGSHKFDPIISIKPTDFFFKLVKKIIRLVPILTVILGVLLLFSDKKKRSK